MAIQGLEGLRRVRILGVPVNAVSKEELPELVEKLIEAEGSRILAPVNAEVLNRAVETPELHDFLNQADLVHADGAGAVFGSKILGDPIPPRITSIYLLWQLCQRWNDGKYSIYFMGGPPGVAEQARDKIHSVYPGVRIVGCRHGFFDSDEERLEALHKVQAAKPDLLTVGFGTPLQEKFILKYREQLAGVPVVWPVGALTSHIAEIFPRAPGIMRKMGMEWLWRLGLEPKRMWRRYILGNPRFVARVVKQRIGI